MGLGKIIDALIMPIGLGGFGVGRGPFGNVDTKAANERRDAAQSSAGKQSPTPAPLPQSPKIEDAATKAGESVKRRRSGVTQTVFTDPLGVSGKADVVRKTLTGQ